MFTQQVSMYSTPRIRDAGTYLSPRALVFLQGRLDPRVMEHVLEVLARAKWARTQAHHEHQQGQYQPSCQASDMFARSSGDSSCSGCSSSSGSRDCGSAVCKPCRYTPEVRANAACKNSSKESAAVQEGTRIPACGMLPFLGLLSKLVGTCCMFTRPFTGPVAPAYLSPISAY